MEFINANPDPETLKMFLWIAASLIALLLMIVGFFLRRELFNDNSSKGKQKEGDKNNTNEYVSKWNLYTEAQDEKWESFEKRQKEYNHQQKEQIDKLESLINKTCESVRNIDKVVEVIKQLDDERNPRIEKQVLEHERRLNSHGHELTYIKAKIENGRKEISL